MENKLPKNLDLCEDFWISWLLLFSRREFLILLILTKFTERTCFSRIPWTKLELCKTIENSRRKKPKLIEMGVRFSEIHVKNGILKSFLNTLTAIFFVNIGS